MRAIRFAQHPHPPLACLQNGSALKVCYEICIALASTALNASTAIERSETKQQNFCQNKTGKKKNEKRNSNPKNMHKGFMYSSAFFSHFVGVGKKLYGK